jgi:hypothetical protein
MAQTTTKILKSIWSMLHMSAIEASPKDSAGSRSARQSHLAEALHR